MSRRLLLLASSPSDLVEMIDLALALSRRGHHTELSYLCELGLSRVTDDVKARLQGLHVIDSRCQGTLINLLPNSDSPASNVAESANRDGLFKRMDLWLLKAWNRYESKYGRGSLNRAAKHLLLRVRSAFMLPSRMLSFGKRLAFAVCQRTRSNFPVAYELLFGAYMLLYYQRHLDIFRAVLKARDWDALLIPEDIVGAVWPVAIKAANELQIPSLIFPYTLANQLEATQSLKDMPAFQTRNNRLVAWLAPRWRWRDGALDLVRLPSGHIAAHKWLKISPPDPWLMNSGYSTAICVDSEASRSYFERAGIPAEKLILTGSVSQDHLFAEQQNKHQQLAGLRQQLNLIGDKPMLLISGCPNQLAGKVPYCEYSSIQDVARHVGQVLAPLGDCYHIVVRPHPNFHEFGELLRPWGFISTDIPTSRLVPLADLFVAFASATIRWSLACAVPTINYDIFNYCYGDFSDARGVVTVNNAAQFESAAKAMKPTSESYRVAKALIEMDSSYWSVMDGRCSERIEAAIDEFCLKPRHG